MIISQDRRRFSSLDDAKNNLDLAGRRVAIILNDKVVTIRPQIVTTFTSTQLQLFQLGEKLGGYPLDVYKERKRECEHRDETKEFIFSYSLAHLNYIADIHSGLIVQELEKLIRHTTNKDSRTQTLTEQVNTTHFLLSNEADQNDATITTIKDLDGMIDLLVSQTIGVEVASYLKLNVHNELRIWINDRFSPYFINKYTESLSALEVYKLLIQHPDIRDLHHSIIKKVEHDFYKANINKQLEIHIVGDPSSEIREDNYQHESLQKTDISIESNHTRSFYNKKKWHTEEIFDVFSKEQILSLLHTYFNIINPIQVIHDLIADNLMSQLYIKDNKDSSQKLATPVHNVNLLIECERKFNENQKILDSHQLQRLKTKHELANHFERSMRSDPLEEDDGSAAKTWFKERILDRSSLTWGEKGVLAFSFFLSKGILNTDKLLEINTQSKPMLKKIIKNLLDKEILFISSERSIYHMKDTKDFDWNVERELHVVFPLQSFESFMFDNELSWDAKGLYTWMQCTDTIEPDTEYLLSLSSSRRDDVERAYNELLEQGYVVYLDNAATVQNQAIEHLYIKEACVDWYYRELGPLLRQVFSINDVSVDLLNAKYPSKYNYNAIQLAAMANDEEMIRKLIKVDGLDLTYLSHEDNPLLLAFRSGSNQAVTILLKESYIAEHTDLVSFFFSNVVMEEVPTDIIVRYLAAYHSQSKDEVVSRLLLPALMRRNRNIIEVLLQAGASPHAFIVDGKTAWDIAKDLKEVDILLMFKPYL